MRRDERRGGGAPQNPRRGKNRALLAASFAAMSLVPGCIYIPPFRDTAGSKTVGRVEPGNATRDDVRERLGRPRILGKSSVYVYDWDQSYGFILVGAGYSGAAGEFKGKHFH